MDNSLGTDNGSCTELGGGGLKGEKETTVTA